MSRILLTSKVYPSDIFDNLSEIMCLHILRHYRSKGLHAFCIKHGINYSSAGKVFRGYSHYPSTVEKIEKSIENDLQELNQSGSLNIGLIDF